MERNKNIDIVKGIGIILMVLGHSGAPFTSFIYLFHMGIFFVLSGICFNSNYSDSINGIKELLIRRIKSLWLPYFFINELFLVSHNLFIKINIYDGTMLSLKNIVIETVKTALFSSSEMLGGATWFLRVLFLTTMLYSIIEFIIKKITKKHLNIIMMVISCLFLLVGYIANLKDISLKLQFDTVFSVFLFFSIGVLIRKKNILNAINKYTYKVPSLLIVIICFVLLIIIGQAGEDISIVNNEYSNPLLYVATTLLGFIMIYYVAEIIKRNNKCLNIMSYLGKNTIPIILLHFLAFKVYMVILITLNIESIDILKVFPIYISSSYDYVIYTIAGVSLPLAINCIYKKCFNNIKDILIK